MGTYIFLLSFERLSKAHFYDYIIQLNVKLFIFRGQMILRLEFRLKFIIFLFFPIF